MPQISHINSITRKWDDTCTYSYNLTEAGVKYPAVRDVVMYSEPRSLFTLLTSGAKYAGDTIVGSPKLKTVIGKIPEGKLIGDNAYRYMIMGRIRRASRINSLVGTPTSDGYFQLSMKDNLLTPGMNVRFYDEKVEARVVSQPSGGPGAYIYTFQTHNGVIFDYNTAINLQVGEKTCFGTFTSFGEASLRGYGRTFYPDWYVQHLGIQRKTIGISGSALTDVVWLNWTDQDEVKRKGWFWEKQRQARAQFDLENEDAKMDGRSTMKDEFGNLLVTPKQFDNTGNPIVKGDGLIPQLEGQNESYGSGADGYATIDDHLDMITHLKKYSLGTQGLRWAVITGPGGFRRAQEELREFWINSMNGQMNVNNGGGVGGPDIQVGANFDTLNFLGNQITFVENPAWGDTEAYPGRHTDGSTFREGLYIYVDMSTDTAGRRNMEILGKGAYGMNHTFMEKCINGMTAYQGAPTTNPVAAVEVNYYREDGLFVYNTKSCGMIHRARY
jgi:hypothetical protein